MVNLNVEVDNYSNRVLGVVKEKYGLKDKSQALVKFVHAFGSEFVEEEDSEEELKRIIKICDETYKKHGNKPMKKEDLKKFFEIE